MNQQPWKRTIFLCGFMGVGKSTVGRLLSLELGVPFVDTDEVIAQQAGMTIPRIFDEEGEPSFRKREEAVVADLAGRAGLVVSLGGGALSSERSRDLIRRSGLLVYLSASVESLIGRLGPKAKSRPLLAGLSPQERRAKIEALMSARETLYERTCDLRVETDGRDAKTVVHEILSMMEGGRQ